MQELDNPEKGMGLLEVLFASAIMLFLLQFLMQSFLNFKNNQKYQAMQLTNDFIADYINGSVGCFQTLAPIAVGSTCTDGNGIQLVKSSGEELLNANLDISTATLVGTFRVRAICRTCAGSGACPTGTTGTGQAIPLDAYIDVQAIRVKENSDTTAANHPLRRDELEKWKSLFYSNHALQVTSKTEFKPLFRCKFR